MAEDKLTFAAIVLVAIVAIVGMIGFTSVGKIHIATGAASGVLNLTIQGTTSITLTDASSNLGAGYVAANTTNATINTEGLKTNWVGNGATDPMILNNNGTTLANVTISASSDASTFIGGTNPSQSYKSTAAGTNCTGTQVTAYATLATTDSNLCTVLQYDDSKDSLTVHYQLVVPNDISQGLKSNTITFTGYTA